MKKRRLLRTLLLLVILGVVVIFATDQWVKSSTKAQLYNDVSSIPHRKVGLLLGTAKFLKTGGLNPYYFYRMEAAAALFRAGKIDFILVSGDNGTEEYDETTTMQTDLLALGIPEEKIFMDYADFRTLDSILRCKTVFGENNITVISQPFHNERAIFIANHKDVNAIGFNARDLSRENGFRTLLREKFARIKMLMDLFFGTGPKFYGPKIEIK